LESLLQSRVTPTARQRATATLKGAAVRRLTIRPVAGDAVALSRATIRIAPTTPPGTYHGTARIADETRPVVAEIEARSRLECHPSRLVLSARPGEAVSVEVTLVNVGNIEFTVPARSNFCLFRDDGVHHALWTALTSEPGERMGRTDMLLDDLASSHGGLVDVRVAGSAPAIAPGHARDVRLRLTFSERLHAGQAYTGTWEVEGLRLPARVTVPPRERSRPSRVVA